MTETAPKPDTKKKDPKQEEDLVPIPLPRASRTANSKKK
jgi:hypothetical protein